MRRLILLALIVLSANAQAQRPAAFGSLTERQTLSGFRTDAVYLNDSGAAMGARFTHLRSGFTLDLLAIQSVPQAFVWVTTFPTSNMGEPHTQEHLLLGKGNKGRAVSNQETMSLSTSTAFTMQWRTCYTFYTSAGSDVFHDEFERRLDALLHPDYSDEEIRREVRNFGVSESEGDASTAKRLGLEEKGTVYNEMVSSMDQPGRRLYIAADIMTYGSDHPLALNSGGTPEALRVIQPADIRRFHAAHYHLANMGAVVSVPKEMSIDSVLSRLDASLNKVEPRRSSQPVKTERDLPIPRPAPAGEIRFVEYPHRNDQQPGLVAFSWPADLSLNVTEQTLLGLFLEAFAGDPTTNLYKRLIDSRTRETEIGAQSVFGGVAEDQGFPVIIGFGDVPVAKMNERDLSDLRTRVLAELSRVAGLAGGSAELREFNERVRSRVLSTRRGLAKFVNSPPGFGFRGNGPEWMTHLYTLNKEPGFRKSVTMQEVLDVIDRLLSTADNPWAQYLPKWKLTGPANPWILAAKPNPALMRTDQEQRSARVAAELTRLKAKYGTTDEQVALTRYRAEYDAGSAEIDRVASRIAPPKFIASPPMTLDDQLDFKTTVLPVGSAPGIPGIPGIPLVASTFDSMTSATTGIALRLDSVPQDRLLYLAMLPQLLTRVGVIENGTPIPYDVMSERMRKEILNLSADFASNPKTSRAELVVRGAGNNAVEAQRAVDWMRLVLFNADWRPENLARIRDVVDQTLSGLRRVMQGAEENWVRGVANAYWRQDNPLLLTTLSFMTEAHSVQRLRWLLKDATPAERTAAAQALNTLASLTGSRAELKARLATMQSGTDKLLADAAKDLDITLTDIPDTSLAADWSHLCREIAEDLSVGPATALAILSEVRQLVLRAGNARLFQIGSTSTQQTLAPSVQALVGGLGSEPPSRANYTTSNLVATRLGQRSPDAVKPLFVGLLNPNSQSGVFINSAPLTGWEDTSRDKLLDMLAVSLYGGGGGHSVFSKTIGAGLAYSNGLGVRLSESRVGYYAERTPALPQTMKFVVGELQKTKPDESLVDYAIAQAFGATRSASGYESRGESMAANLADGLTPDVVRRFHEGVLALRSTPNLAEELHRRMMPAVAKVLPGMGPKPSTVDGAIYFVIGPEQQFAAWEEYLKSIEGPAAKVYRLYPRDFWLQ